jgi:hypothetical protein
VGHIFGVESPLMVEKLEQYNRVIEVPLLSCYPDVQWLALVNVVTLHKIHLLHGSVV